MKFVYLCVIVAVITQLSGCAIRPKIDLDTFYAHRPRSIVVVPVVNESPEVSAPSVFISTISQPLAERGYYVFPVYLTDLILKDFGLVEAGHVHQLPAQRFNELFGADAVLLVTIKDWSTKYLVLASVVVVEMEYVLKDTRTGLVLWENKQTYTHDSGSPGSGGGVGGLVVMAVAAAVNAIFTDYLPLARKANHLAFQPPKGLPAGPYHADFRRDQEKF